MDHQELNLDEVREQVKKFISTGKSQEEVAKTASISSGALSSFLAGTYKGANDRIAQKLMAAIGTEEKRKTAVTTVKEPDIVETATMQEIQFGLQYASDRNDVLILTGPPGIGKTKTMERFVEKNPSSIFVTATPNCCTPSEVLDEILDTMGKKVEGRRRVKEKAIYQMLKKTNRMLIIDEGHFLNLTALETLRGIHDMTKCPIVICGNPKLWEVINERNKTVTGQFFSRAVRMDLTGKVPMEDVKNIIVQNGIELTENCLQELHKVANMIGSLRVMVKLFLFSWTIAANGNQPLGIEHIQAASKVIISLR